MEAQHECIEQLLTPHLQAAKVGEQVNKEATNGIWVFDAEKAAAAKSPYHPDVNPPIYVDTGARV